MEPPKKVVRSKQVLTPEQEAARKARRRQQLVEAQARRRARLVGALDKVEGAVQADQEIQYLRAQVKSLQSSVALHKERQSSFELAYLQLEGENKRLREKRLKVSSSITSSTRSPSKLVNRVDAIIQAMTQYEGKEKAWLESYAKLSKKWSTDAKTTATKVENIHAVTTGQRAIAGKGLATTQFAVPLLSDEENQVLAQATLVLVRIADDVDNAAQRIGMLHKRREAERQERYKQADKALALFDKLDMDNKILFVAMRYTRHDTGYGSFDDLVRGLGRSESRDRWWKATKHFEDSYKERRTSIAHQVADAMKDTGRTADDLAGEAFQKFTDAKPKIVAEWPDLVRNIKTEIVKEHMEKSA